MDSTCPDGDGTCGCDLPAAFTGTYQYVGSNDRNLYGILSVYTCDHDLFVCSSVPFYGQCKGSDQECNRDLNPSWRRDDLYAGHDTRTCHNVCCGLEVHAIDPADHAIGVYTADLIFYGKGFDQYTPEEEQNASDEDEAASEDMLYTEEHKEKPWYLEGGDKDE